MKSVYMPVRVNGQTAVAFDIEAAITDSPFLDTQMKRDMARIISREFIASGAPIAIAMAAVANAAAESGLNTLAGGDGGTSVGLFQLNRSKGAGVGMTVSQCQDPTLNTRKIIQEYNAARNYTRQKDSKTQTYITTESINQALASGASAARLASLFGLHVERPYDMIEEQKNRANLARAIFPGFADMDNRLLLAPQPMVLAAAPKEEEDEQPSYLTWFIPLGLGLVVASSAVLAAFWWKKRKQRNKNKPIFVF